MRRPLVFGEASGIKNVEATGTAEAQTSVGKPVVSPGIEFLALQPMLAMVGLDRSRLRVQAHETGIAAEPDSSPGVRERAIDRIAREPVFAGHGPEMDCLRCIGATDDPGQTAAVGGHPHVPLRV